MAQTVLVADDSIASQRLFEMVLTREGYDVVTVGSGPDVLNRVKEQQPDLALIDAIMPGVDGYQICQALRQDPQFKSLPVIMLAGAYENIDRDKGAQIVGANAILSKPAKAQDILAKVKEMLAIQAQAQKVVEPSSTPTIAETAPVSEAEVVQEPSFVEGEYEFDEDSEEVDLAVESEILDEEAEWEEVDEEIMEIEGEPIEEPVSEISETASASASVPVEESRSASSVSAAVATPGRMAISEEHLEVIAEEIAQRVAGKLIPALMESFAAHVLQIPSVKHVVEDASKNLVKEILPEIQDRLK